MASPQNALVRDLDQAELLKEIADLYRGGWSQKTIAKHYGIDQSTVSDALNNVRQMWLQSAVRNFDALKELELRKIDELEAAAWEGWERSKKPKKTSKRESIGTLQGDSLETSKVAVVKGRIVRVKAEREDSVGDPRFLTIIGGCIDKRCQILGLDAPKKLDVEAKVDIGAQLQAKGVDVEGIIVRATQLTMHLLDKPAEEMGDIIEGIAQKLEAE